MDRLGKQAGFNHYATTIVDPTKAQDFYVKVLGGDYPGIETVNLTTEQVVLHGWFRQAPTNDNLRVELLAFTANKGKTPTGFEVPGYQCELRRVSGKQH
jgi:hypothetical protein